MSHFDQYEIAQALKAQGVEIDDAQALAIASLANEQVEYLSQSGTQSAQEIAFNQLVRSMEQLKP